MKLEGENMNKFNERFKSERKNKNLTQKELADVFNTDKSTISKYENGHNKPDIDVLIKYADFFEVSIDYLLGRTEAKIVTSEIVMNDDLAQICEDLINTPKVISILDELKNLSEPDIDKIIKIIKAFKE